MKYYKESNPKKCKMNISSYILGNFSMKRYFHMSNFAIWALVGTFLFLIIAHPFFDNMISREIPDIEFRYLFKGLFFFILLYLINGFIFQLHQQ